MGHQPATTGEPGPLRVVLLGGFRVARGDEPISDAAWQRRSARQLVKLLATHPTHRLHREEVEELLWPEGPPGAADGKLRKALHYARHALEPDLAPRQPSAYLHLDDELLALDPDRCAVDADAFETAAAAALASGELDALRDACDGYPAELLPEDRYEDWSASRREALAALHRSLLLEMATAHERRGERGAAAELLRRLLRDDPAGEEVHRRLMTLAAAGGNRHEALRQYQACRAALRDELGVDPEPETERLYQEVLAGRAVASGLAAPALPAIVRRQAERPLIGRDDALGTLRAALDRAARGDGGAVLVRGEMGVGKSRLLAELALAAHGRGTAVLWGTAWEQEDHLPYGPIAEALDGALAARPVAERERLATAHPALAALIPSLGPAGDAPPERGDRRARLFASVARVLADLAREGPLLLVLDDLHAADTSTLQLLHHLARSAPGHRWLIVGAMRDDVPAGSGAQRLAAGSGHGDPFRRIALPRLSREEADALLAGVVDGEPAIDPALAGAVHGRALGNPFVAIEIMRALIERGAVVRDGGAWTLRDALADEVPGQVRELVEARVDRLGDSIGRVLALVATAGPGCSFPLLRDASGLDEPALLDALDAALAARVLEERDDGYTFTHPIFRPTLYERLTRPRRASMHAALARALETRDDGSPPGAVEALAHHWAEAGEPARAVPWLIAAADHAARVYAHADAIDRLARALTLLEAPAFPAGAAREHRIAVQRRLGDLYALTGNSLLAREAYLAMLAEDDLPPLRAAAAHRLAATQSMAMNDLSDAEAHLATASALLEPAPAGPDRDRERLRFQIAAAREQFLALRFEASLATAEAAIQKATRLGSHPELVQAMEMAAMACLPLGLWERGAGYERRHAALADVNRFVRDIADVHFCFAEYHVYASQPEEDAFTFERAVDAATRIAAPRSLALCNYYLGVTAYFHGRFREALARETEAIGRYRQVDSSFGEAIGRQIRGAALTALGRLDDGRDELERGLALARHGALRSHVQIRLYAALCRNRIDANDADGARRYADAGLALTEEPSTCICYASFLPGAAVAYGISGDLARAEALGERAVAGAVEFDSPAFTCMALQATGIVHALAGEWDAARTDLDRAQALAQGHGFPYELARVLLAQSFVHIQRRDRGDLRAATRLMAEASTKLMRLGVRTSAAQMKASMGFLRAHSAG